MFLVTYCAHAVVRSGIAYNLCQVTFGPIISLYSRRLSLMHNGIVVDFAPCIKRIRRVIVDASQTGRTSEHDITHHMTVAYRKCGSAIGHRSTDLTQVDMTSMIFGARLPKKTI